MLTVATLLACAAEASRDATQVCAQRLEPSADARVPDPPASPAEGTHSDDHDVILTSSTFDEFFLQLNYIDADNAVQLKGRVAREVRR